MTTKKIIDFDIKDNEEDIEDIDKKISKTVKSKSEDNEKDYLIIKQGEAYLKIPKDKSLIIKIRKFLEICEKEFENDLSSLKLSQEVENNKDSQVYKSIVPKIKPKEEIEQEIDQFSKHCPLCASKLKKKKIRREGNVFKQLIKCKKWSCPFEKEIVINI